MKKLIALTSVALLLVAWNGTAQTGMGVEQKIDSLFSRYNAETPGVSVAIVKDGKVIFKKGYGTANLEYGIPNTPETVFQIASVSKQFTAFAIYLLERQGKLSFEDDIRKYFPELPDYGKTIRVRHLLAHTSGVRDLWAFLTLAGWHVEDVITTEQILKLAAKQKKLNFEPGSAFGYSNTGYSLLAQIVERITGQSFARFTQDHIFGPLQMTRTQFCDDYHKIVKNRADSYEKVNGAYVKRTLNYADVGPTSVLTTVEDMAKWASNFDNPKTGDAGLIAQFNKVSLLDNGRPVIWSVRGEGDTTYHAKGQLSWRYRGLPAITHGGHVAGFRAWLARFPENDLSIVTLSNDEHYDIFGTGVTIAGFYLKDEFRDTAAANSPLPPVNDQSKKYSSNLKDFQGEYYCDELTTTYVINVQGDKLVMSHNRLPDMELTHTGDNKFSGTNSFAFEMEFLKSGKEVAGFKISNFGAKNVQFRRIK